MLAPIRRADGPVKNSRPRPLLTPNPEVSGSKFTYFGKLGARYHKLFPEILRETFPNGVFWIIFAGKL